MGGWVWVCGCLYSRVGEGGSLRDGGGSSGR